MHALFLSIENHVFDLRWFECFENVFTRIGAPADDVHLFVVQLAHNIFHARPAHADAGADWIHFFVGAPNGDLSAVPGFARNAADLDCAVREAMRPKFRGVTSTSTVLPTFVSGLTFCALANEISSCGFVMLSTTIRLASARISPVFGSMSIRRSRAAPTLFLEADSKAFETASSRISRLMPRSRSR